MYLETPKKFRSLANQAHQVAENYFRPISRKYDKAEHAYPKELDLLAALLDGMNSGSPGGCRCDLGEQARRQAGRGGYQERRQPVGVARRDGTVLGRRRPAPGHAAPGAGQCGDRRGGQRGAVAALRRHLGGNGDHRAGLGSDSAAIRTTATQDGDHYVLNGEKIFVTSGERADAVVVWATLNRNLGRAAIKSFVVEKGTPGMTVTRLEKKLGIKASDTASISFNDCRVPAANLLGNAEVDVQKGFAGVMETFDNTRPLVAGMAVGVAKAALDRTRELLKKAGCKFDYRKPLLTVSHAEATLYRLEAEWEAARLLTLKAAWMADNKLPNSKEASIAKARAGRVANEITLKCVELAGALGYAEDELLEKWARDSKILDIFEGTQQIQLLIVARRLLGKSSSQLK